MKEFAQKSAPPTEINLACCVFFRWNFVKVGNRRVVSSRIPLLAGRKIRVRGRIDLRPLVSIIHHRDYFKTGAVESHSERAFSKRRVEAPLARTRG